MKRLFVWGGIYFGVVLMVGLAALMWMARSFERSLEPKVALDQYAKLVAERTKGSEAYSFLPRDIDSAAERNAFYWQPGFLQGGEVICLRQKLPKLGLEDILSKLEQSGRKEVPNFEGIASPRCFPRYGISEPMDLFRDVGELPKGFRIFLFKSDLEDIKKDWNHNFLAFTAVSLNEREVVYYAEAW